MRKIRLLPANSARMVLISFLTVILLGTLLLWSDACARKSHTSFIDALFTATSATCVTGLTVLDTGAHFNFFGQIVILCLIQLGGLGVMTFSTFFWIRFRRRTSLATSDAVLNSLSAHYDPDIGDVLGRVLRLVPFIEAIGATVLAIRFLFDGMRWYKALWYGIFHSISAFCNAGFSLFPNSFENYVSDPIINIVIPGLFITGGIGFPVIVDIQKWSEALRVGRRYFFQFHTKLVLYSTLFLLVFGAVAIYLLESQNTLRGLSPAGRIMASFFASATPRTAGFNTLPMAKLEPATLFLTVILMFIGGSPCSTAGGVKTTTIAVLLLHAMSRYRDREQVTFGNRGISNEAVDRSQVIVLLSVTALTIFSFAVLSAQRGVGTPMGLVLFEVCSAFGTVGLSTGITGQLTPAARVIVSLLMFFGRLGALSFVAGLAVPSQRLKLRYPEEPVIVG